MTTTNRLITEGLPDDSVPLSRKLAINGIEQDLSEDRTWTTDTIYPLSMRTKVDDFSEASTIVSTELLNDSIAGAMMFGTLFTSTTELIKPIIDSGAVTPSGNWDDSGTWDDDTIWTDN